MDNIYMLEMTWYYRDSCRISILYPRDINTRIHGYYTRVYYSIYRILFLFDMVGYRNGLYRLLYIDPTNRASLLERISITKGK